MLRGMPFDSVHDALEWYYKRPWARGGNYARSNFPDGERVQSSPLAPPAEVVCSSIKAVGMALLDLLNRRNRDIIRVIYRKNRAKKVEAMLAYNITDKGMQYVKEQIIARIEPEFIRRGIVRPPKTVQPVPLPCVVASAVCPDDEIRFMQDGKIVARITNVKVD